MRRLIGRDRGDLRVMRASDEARGYSISPELRVALVAGHTGEIMLALEAERANLPPKIRAWLDVANREPAWRDSIAADVRKALANCSVREERAEVA